MAWLSFFWAATLGSVVVRGESTCPAPSDVAGKLAPLVRSSSDSADVADIVRQGSVVTVSLASADGRPIGRQTLEGGRCDDLAEAAAVILATWENDEARRTGMSLAPPAAPAQPREPSTRRTWDVAVGVGGALQGGSLSPTLIASGSISPAGGMWGLRAGGGLEGSGTTDLPHGAVRWNRFVAGGGPKVAWGESIAGEAHVGAYVGWVRTEGEGFADNRQGTGFEVAFVASARISLGGRGLRPFVEGAVSYRPSPVAPYELPAGGDGKLPGFGVFVVAGALLGR
jgi:hypothetical protein